MNAAMAAASRRHLWLGALALLLALPGLVLARRMFFACWLAAWWFVLGVILGALSNVWMHRLTGGGWGTALRPATRLLARRLPWLLLLFVPLLFGLDALYPWWTDSAGAWRSPMTQPGFNRVWLDHAFFGIRLAGYALVWWWLARPVAADAAMSGGRAAAALTVHTVLTSLAAVDLLMSLVPLWFSTAYGLVVLSSQVLAGSAATVALTALYRADRVRSASPSAPPDSPSAPPLWRDFGNLLLAWVLGHAYLAFMQLLVIWAENLPREIAWYIPRLQTGWIGAGVALVLLGFALPLCALLLRALKDRPGRLAVIALLLLGAGVLDAAWQVLPSVDASSRHGWWLLPLMVAGMGLLLFGDLPEALRQAPNEGSGQDAADDTTTAAHQASASAAEDSGHARA